jgi:hypothetical protein
MESPVEVEKIEGGTAHVEERARYPLVLLLVALGQIGWGVFIVLLAVLPALNPAARLISAMEIERWYSRIIFNPIPDPFVAIYLLLLVGVFRIVCGVGLLGSMRWSRDWLGFFSLLVGLIALRGLYVPFMLEPLAFRTPAELARLALPGFRQTMVLHAFLNGLTLLVLVDGPGVAERFHGYGNGTYRRPGAKAL